MGTVADEYAHAYCVNRQQLPRQAVAIIVYQWLLGMGISFWGVGTVPSQTPPPIVRSCRLIFNALANCVNVHLLCTRPTQCSLCWNLEQQWIIQCLWNYFHITW